MPAENLGMDIAAPGKFTKDYRHRTPEELCFFGTHGFWPNEAGTATAREIHDLSAGNFNAGPGDDRSFFSIPAKPAKNDLF